MKHHFILGLLVLLFSCGQTNLSEVEVIKFDPDVINKLKETSDTSFTEYVGRSDFYNIDHYINYKDSVTAQIFKDSLGNVVAYTKTKRDMVFFSVEYYPNGQVRGKLPNKTNGQYNGQARYYFEEGRVSSEGLFKNGLWFGEWKNYDKTGHLISIDDYGTGSSTPIKTIKIK